MCLALYQALALFLGQRVNTRLDREGLTLPLHWYIRFPTTVLQDSSSRHPRLDTLRPLCLDPCIAGRHGLS